MLGIDWQMQLTGKTQSGNIITDVASWFEHAPPAKGAAQWKDYRSAKEVAQAWCRYGEVRCPEEMSAILSNRRETRGLVIEHAVAEMEIAFDEFAGGKRNADLALWGHMKGKQRVAVTVEAKADETSGNTVKKQLASAPTNRGSNIPKRVARLLRGIIGRDVDATIDPLRYQLFHALAATAKLAQAKNADLGVLIIHEFISLTIDFDNLVENANDLTSFVHTISGWENQSLKVGKLLPPIRLPGSECVPNDVSVSIGKIRTLIPLFAGGRRTTTTIPTSQTLLIEGPDAPQ